MKTKERVCISPRLRLGGVPKRIWPGHFLWHNHVAHCVGMSHGVNGFRYWFGKLPINYKNFEPCSCGVVPLKHYKVRGLGSGKCVPPEKIFPWLKNSAP